MFIIRLEPFDETQDCGGSWRESEVCDVSFFAGALRHLFGRESLQERFFNVDGDEYP